MFLFLLSESFNIIKRTKFATIVTILTTSIAIVLVSLSLFLILLSHKLDQTIKSQIKITVFLEDSLGHKDITTLKKQILQDAMVGNIKFISKTQAKRDFIRKTGRDFSEILKVNPLPASFVISLNSKNISIKKIEHFVNNLKHLSGVTDVVYNYRLTIRILHFLKSIRSIIYISSFLLVIISIYLVYTTNRLAILSRLDIYEIMKLVGTKLSTMKIPLVINGIIIGIISSVLSFGVYYVAIHFITKIYPKITGQINLYQLSIVLLIIGVLLGMLGSYFSTKKISLKI